MSGEGGKLRSQIPVSEEPPFQSKSVRRRDMSSARPQHESFTKLGSMASSHHFITLDSDQRLFVSRYYLV